MEQGIGGAPRGLRRPPASQDVQAQSVSSSPISRAEDPVRILLLAVFVILAVTSLIDKSPTFDEPNHLYQGFRFLVTGDPTLRIPDHPPGVEALAAVPLLGRGHERASRDVGDPRSRFHTAASIRRFLEADDAAVLRDFARARSVVVFFGAVLGALVYAGAGRAYGRSGARLALALYCLDPNFLAHGRLVTTDLGVSLGYWSTVLALFRWAERPSFPRCAVMGGALGFALLAKFSAIALLPILIVAPPFLLFGRDPSPVRRGLKGGAVAIAIAFGTVWAVYGFDVGTMAQRRTEKEAGRRTTEVSISGEESVAKRSNLTSALENAFVFAPEYWAGVRKNIRHGQVSGHVSYLRGQHGRYGWTSYFPYAIAVKTPIPTLILLALAITSFLVRRPSREEIVLVGIPVAYLGTAMSGSLNIGYRHILPIFPFLFVLVGRLVAFDRPDVASRPGVAGRATRATKIHVAFLLLLVGALAGGTLRTHPHYLPYFNEFVGGSEGGIDHLVDSNLDWGQDLPELARWLDLHGVGRVSLALHGVVDPSHYGISWLPIRLPRPSSGRPLEPDEVPIGVYAVSASRLVGLQSLGKTNLAVFRRIEPVATIGHSIRVYVIEGDG